MGNKQSTDQPQQSQKKSKNKTQQGQTKGQTKGGNIDNQQVTTSTVPSQASNVSNKGFDYYNYNRLRDRVPTRSRPMTAEEIQNAIIPSSILPLSVNDVNLIQQPRYFYNPPLDTNEEFEPPADFEPSPPHPPYPKPFPPFPFPPPPPTSSPTPTPTPPATPPAPTPPTPTNNISQKPPIIQKVRYNTTSSVLKSPEGFVLRMPNMSNSSLMQNFFSPDTKERINLVSVNEGDNVKKGDMLLQVSLNVNGQLVISNIYSSENGYVAYVVPLGKNVKINDIVAVLVKNRKDMQIAKNNVLNPPAPVQSNLRPRESATAKRSSSTSAPTPKLPVPNQLNITVRTSIPGYQKFTFKPSMLEDVKKDESSIQFNPLIKLQKSVIDKIPDNLRVVEFFNKGLFESLIYKTNATPAETLNLANQYGYIDHNIDLTLKTIFYNGSVIKIGGKPYVIGDVRWRKGDWKIDLKQKKEEFDPNKIRDPYLYSAVVKEDLISGEQQLQVLEQNAPQLIYGSNFTGQRNATALGPVSNNENNQAPQQAPPQEPVQAPAQIPSLIPKKPDISNLFLPHSVPNSLIPAPPSNIPSQNNVTKVQLLLDNGDKNDDVDDDSVVDNKDLETIEFNTTTGKVLRQLPAPQKIEELPEIEPSAPEPVKRVNEHISRNNTTILREYFSNVTYYELLNTLYKNSNSNVKETLSSILYNTTDFEVKRGNKTLSKNPYMQTANNLLIVENEGAGNCFFLAVADAINFHNNSYPNNRITSGNYGVSQLFDQNFLRNIVANYFINRLSSDYSWQETIRFTTTSNEDELNRIFNNTLEQSGQTAQNLYRSNPRQYLTTANDVYTSNPELNFLIKLPKQNSMPINPEQPFLVCSDEQEIMEFFLSPYYWGDENAIYALANSELRLNVIPIENHIEGTNSLLRIPWGIFSNLENNNWNKYLFLYNTGGHFELMCFNNFKKNKLRVGKKKITETLFIFDRNSSNMLPPLYIILLLFGSKFIYESKQIKDTFSVLPVQMHTINDVFNKIQDPNFTTSFETFFPPPRSIRENKANVQASLALEGPEQDVNDIPIKSLNSPTTDTNNSKKNITHSLRRSQRIKNNTKTQKGGVRVSPYQRYPNYSYPNYSYPNYSSSYSYPYKASKMLKNEKQYDTSKLAFDITIMLELYPGTSITNDQLSAMKCDSRWESVRQAWADFVGKPYVIIPEYQKLKKIPKRDNNKTQRDNSYQRNSNI
jgi:hypothetical protein